MMPDLPPAIVYELAINIARLTPAQLERLDGSRVCVRLRIDDRAGAFVSGEWDTQEVAAHKDANVILWIRGPILAHGREHELRVEIMVIRLPARRIQGLLFPSVAEIRLHAD